jgi:hypothetical protein
MTTEAYQGNPRLRNVRIEVGGTARQIMDGTQRVTMVPLTIRRKQNRRRHGHSDDQNAGQGVLLAALA